MLAGLLSGLDCRVREVKVECLVESTYYSHRRRAREVGGKHRRTAQRCAQPGRPHWITGPRGHRCGGGFGWWTGRCSDLRQTEPAAARRDGGERSCGRVGKPGRASAPELGRFRHRDPKNRNLVNLDHRFHGSSKRKACSLRRRSSKPPSPPRTTAERLLFTPVPFGFVVQVVMVAVKDDLASESAWKLGRATILHEDSEQRHRRLQEV